MNQLGAEAKVLIRGTIEYRDKDGNLIKSVPFAGTGALDVPPPQDEKEEEPDGDLCE